MSKILVTLDACIFDMQTVVGGISRIYRNILPYYTSLTDSINTTIITRKEHNIPSYGRSKHLVLKKSNKKIIKILQSLYYDNIIISSRNPDAIWHSTYYTLPVKWSGPIVTMVYDMIHETYEEFINNLNYDKFRLQKKRAILESDRILSISNATAYEIRRVYDSEFIPPIDIVHLAAGDNFRIIRNLDYRKFSHKPFFLYVGRRNLYKDFDTLITAYVNSSLISDYNLVAVGPEWTHQERLNLAELGIESKVILYNGICDRILSELYNCATAFVFPSLCEGFGIPLLEAMKCGCPIIASDIPTTREVAADVPFYFRSGDSALLSIMLEQISSDSCVVRKRDIGFDIAKAYNWRNTAEAVIDSYKKAIQMKRSQRS